MVVESLSPTMRSLELHFIPFAMVDSVFLGLVIGSGPENDIFLVCSVFFKI